MGEKPGIVKCFLFAMAVVGALMVPAARGAEGLESRVERLEEENAALRGLVDEMRARLEQLEGKAALPEASPAIATPTLEARLTSLEKQAEDQKDRGWLYSQAGEQFRVSGRVEFEYRDTQREDDYYFQSTEHAQGMFQLDKGVLRVDSRFSRDIDGRLRLDIYDDRARVREAYLDWGGLPLDSRLRAGLMRKFWRPGRTTEVYPLVGNAFWRSRDLGLDWRWRHAPFYGHFAVYNGLPLGVREIGEDESFPMIRDRFRNVDFNQNKEVAAGLGWRRNWDAWGRTDLLLWGSRAKLSRQDLDLLDFAFEPIVLPGSIIKGYPDSDDDDKTRLGVNARYDLAGLRLRGQYIAAEDGELERDGWYAEVSYLFEREAARFFRSFRPLVRYDELQLGLPASPFNSLSWDRRRWTLALITELRKNVLLKAEYYWNDETTGAGSLDFASFPDRMPFTGYSRRDTIHNDEFLLQLRWEF